MNSDNFVIAVASDLHCKFSNGKNTSEVYTYLTSDLMQLPVERNPIESLKKIIKEEKIIAQLLLCPGDITDKIDKQGLVSGWKYLEDVKAIIGAKLLAATAGNHDVDSRGLHGNDPLDFLQRLTTNFPTTFSSENQKYWANHFCLISDEEYDLLIFNSSYIQRSEKSCNESVITETILKQIEKELEPIRENGKIKIALCHHHPIKHSNMDYKDGDSIEKGDELIQILELNNFNLFIHGHKHDPRLSYKNSIPVFAAGSFSSIMNLIDLGAQNTFHIIEVNKVSKKGIIKTWVYGPKYGWQQKNDTYFPCFTGFGAKVDIRELARKCAGWISQQKGNFISYPELVAKFPDLDFLIPIEQQKLNSEMKEKYMIEFLPNLPNKPRGLTKLY